MERKAAKVAVAAAATGAAVSGGTTPPRPPGPAVVPLPLPGLQSEAQKPAHIADLEIRLRELLGTKVTIEERKNGRRGKIIIEFYSLDDFDRLAEKMGLAEVENV